VFILLQNHTRLKYHLQVVLQDSHRNALSRLVLYPEGAFTMDITSPFVVVPVIIAVFVAAILFATSSKEDGHSAH